MRFPSRNELDEAVAQVLKELPSDVDREILRKYISVPNIMDCHPEMMRLGHMFGKRLNVVINTVEETRKKLDVNCETLKLMILVQLTKHLSLPQKKVDKPPVKDPLVHFGIVPVPGVPSFSPAKTFLASPGPIKFGHISEDFRVTFTETVEALIKPITLNIYKLAANSTDSPILAQLGDRAGIALSHIWELLKLQPSGELGALDVDCSSNIFYYRIPNGEWKIIILMWGRSVGWDLFTGLPDLAGEWKGNHRVFSY